MKSRCVFWLLMTLLLTRDFLAQAQQQAKVAKIGTLGTGSGSSPGNELLRRELRTLGYVEGKNIAFEYQYADGNLERLPALADELVGLKVDVLIAPTGAAALAITNATKALPIVFYNISDPVAVGLVDSLARPGGNITGITNIAAMLAGKRLELLKETIPKLSRVAVLWDPQDAGSAMQWKEGQLAARDLGLQLYSMEVSRAEKYEGAFKEATHARSAALAVTQHALATFNQKRITDLAIKNRVPAIHPREDFVVIGGLMSYGAARAEPYRRVASMIDKILKGTKPADIPVEQPTKFELMINLKTAKALGLTIPQSVLFRADRVIK